MTVVLRAADDLGAAAPVRAAVDALVAAGAGSGLFFDFDGVLARIQPDPESVRPMDGVVDALAALLPKVGTVALVSARNAAFLRDRLGALPGVELHGLYGLERIDRDGVATVVDAARAWVEPARALLAEAVRALPGVYVEDKTLSVGLHYRRAPSLRGQVERWAAEAAGRTGFVVQPGRMAVELKPPVAVDKGTTLTALVAGLRAAWYFGDDLGDLPAFAALRARAAADPAFHGLAVGIGNDTVVDEVRRAADVFLTSPDLLVHLLRHLDSRLPARG
ncbi:MAG TPA: trehalose-phosphatase [Pseudonocardiaceae bacterium]